MSTRLPNALFAALLLLPLSVSSHAQETDQKAASQPDKFTVAEPPAVRRIVFYNSGIAQILHQGEIAGNQRVEISFDRNQIDDVLKSLVFDNEAGAIESVQYQPAPGKEAIAADQLGPPMTLAQTLQKYRGERIEIELDGKKLSGAILGIETRNDGQTTADIVTLVTDKGLQSFALPDIETIQFESKKTQSDFGLAMAGLVSSRDVQRETLAMYFSGQGKRKIQFGYVVDAPVWRMTYRLDIGEKKSSLQGWAHVDNVTGFDFENVYIDLKSGRPQAFNVELFTPLVAQREKRSRSIYGIPDDLSIAPYFGLSGQNLSGQSFGIYGGNFQGEGWYDSGRRYGGGFGGGQGGGGGFGGGMGGGFGGGGMGGGGGGGGGFGGGGSFGNADDEETVRQPLDIGEGIKFAAKQGRAARMIEFKIKKPINLASGHSAMLPILSQEIETKLITQFDLTEKNATANLIVKITNGDQFSIIPGPTTVYQSGQFIGDAELKRTDINDSTMLVYGTDQPVSLEIDPVKTDLIPQRARIDRTGGTPTIVLEKTKRNTHLFHVSNKDVDPRLVILKMFVGESKLMPINDGQHVGQAKKAKNAKASKGQPILIAKTATFEWEVPPDTKIEKEVVLESPESETFKLISLEPETLAAWKNTDVKIDEEVEALITNFMSAQKEVVTTYDAAGKIKEQLDSLVAEQLRLLKIINSFRSDPSAAPFKEKVSSAEARIEKLRPEFEAAKEKLETARRNLSKITTPAG